MVFEKSITNYLYQHLFRTGEPRKNRARKSIPNRATPIRTNVMDNIRPRNGSASVGIYFFMLSWISIDAKNNCYNIFICVVNSILLSEFIF